MSGGGMDPTMIVSTEAVDGQDMITVEVSSLKSLQDFISSRPVDQQIVVRISNSTTPQQRKLITQLCNLTVAPYYGPVSEDHNADDQGESSGASKEKKEEKKKKKKP